MGSPKQPVSHLQERFVMEAGPGRVKCTLLVLDLYWIYG